MKIKCLVILLAALFGQACSNQDSQALPGDPPKSRWETQSTARADARAAIVRGDYRFLGHSGGIAFRQTADGLPGLPKQLREQVIKLTTSDPSRPPRTFEEREQLAKYAALRRARTTRVSHLGWDAPDQELTFPAIGVECAYYYTCSIEQPQHSRRILYIESYNSELLRRMDERGRNLWNSVGVSIRR